MLNLSGYRPPQFSEDVNWLPAWLQPCESSEHIRGDSQYKPTIGVLPYQNNVTREEADLLSSEGRYKSCHLHLSAEDSTPLTCDSSPANIPNFHLHLSMGSYSENTQNGSMEISQAEKFEPDHALLMLCSGTSPPPNENTDLYKGQGCQHAGSTDWPASQVENSDKLGPQDTSSNLDGRTKHDDHVKLVEVGDITAAVELSIAASEALLIHEIIDSGQTTNSLSASAILEIALRVKQARVEDCGEATNIMHGETGNTDYLSDLDDSTMRDAYEEVGLSLCALHLPSSDLSISQVQDTHSLQKYETDERFNHEELERIGADIAHENTKQPEVVACFGIQLQEDDVLMPFDSVRQKSFINDLSLGLEVTDIAYDANVMETPEIVSTTKKVAAMEDYTTLHVTKNTSHHTMISEKSDKNDLTDKAQEKFQSRWFGGWTQKNEVYTSAAMEHNHALSIPKYFYGETSILSESADIAPDENSFVHKPDKVSSLASQSSVPSKCLRNGGIETTYFDEDIVNSSTPSMVDPLCSFVPCSISLENTCSNLAQNHKGQAKTSNCCIASQEDYENNMQRSSSANTFISEQESTVQVTDSVISQPIARRKGTSLRAYSMLLPVNSTYIDNGKYHKSSPSRCNFNKSCSFFQSSLANTTDGTRNSDDSAKDTSELVLHKKRESSSPINLNLESECFHASKSPILDIDRGENPEFRSKGDGVFLFDNMQIAEAHNSIVPGRKRVHFAEADSSSLQKRKSQMMDTAYSVRSTRRKIGLMSEYKYTKRRPYKTLDKNLKRHMLKNMKFLLTGFSRKKEKEIEGLIITYGGIVLSDIPSPPTSRTLKSSRFRCQVVPVIVCSRKLQTVKFLYGCAIKACLVTVDWLKDSVCAGYVLPSKKYMILPNLCDEMCPRVGNPTLSNKYIFDRVGIMLQGKPSFCNKIAKVIKHGGGIIFKTLHVLVQGLDAKKISVGAIVTEDESRLSRHLKQCALEQKIPLMPDTWIIKSLYTGNLLPFIKNSHLAMLSSRLPNIPVSQEVSQVI